MVSVRHPAPSAPGAPVKPLLAGGLIFAVLGLMFDFQGMRSLMTPAQKVHAGECEAIVQTEAQLSREQLAQLLIIPERDTKERVRQIVSEPYCRLPELNVRSGVVAEREAYPLAFDPSTQLVILYENNEYAGYRFSFE
ncbi:hypothetical protein [Pseudanabaena sp. FACHB-2040]|uniref:hypothetical protein n=1 Tax=Pseudanabaena sp. FACHB-2040 TaxID=2692859 RepID=UPI0016861A3C|nr:hypothetical protein [Pseudanabaena sp. FACHB-2040]MBD0266807.1 hypothetical protein [Cyanobacteria bacterium Co-bin8]MBD2259196.1 hypothetical protein [Pseudanabaena sp. FACHB-2040]